MRILMASLMALALGGCSSSGTRTVSGQLDLTQMRLQNAQVVAISSGGRVFRAPIAQNGSFSLALPTHASYSLRFANATNVAGRYDAFATLTAHRPSGATHWFTMTAGGAINLGLVSRAGTTAPKGVGGLSTASDGTGSDGSGDSSSGMSSGEQEDDGAEACDVSGGSDDADVASQNDVNDAVDSDHDDTPDSADSSDATCSASSASGDDCEVSDSEGKDLDESADQPCSGGGVGGGTAVTPSPGLI